MTGVTEYAGPAGPDGGPCEGIPSHPDPRRCLDYTPSASGQAHLRRIQADGVQRPRPHRHAVDRIVTRPVRTHVDAQGRHEALRPI